MLTNWIGDHGFLHTLDVSVRKPNLVGDTIWWTGEVISKDIQEGYGVVKFKVRAVNQKDELSADGTASAVLPILNKGPIRFPLPHALV
jgi:acyl dehydratase